MRLDIASLLNEVGNEAEIDKNITVDFSADGIEIAGKPRIKLRLVNTGELVIANGTIDTTVMLACSRCLNKFSQPLHIDVSEQFSRNAQQLNKDITDPEEAEILPIEDDETIDLSEVIRQNIILNLPMKPICSEKCGSDKKTGKAVKKIDPRLMKLKGFTCLPAGRKF